MATTKIDAAGILRDAEKQKMALSIDAGISIKEESPMDAFPEEIKSLILSWNECLGFHIEYLVLSMLSVISAAIGTAQQIKVKNGWLQYGSIYGALVGRTGDKKTHPLEAILKPLKEYNRTCNENYMHEMALYKKQQEEDRENKVPSSAEKPICKQIIIGDSTIEATCSVIRNNPHGLILTMDELSYWLANFSRYNKGSDEAFWLMAFNNGSWTVNRKMDDYNLEVQNIFINVIGTIQYEILQDQMKGSRRDSGFLARIPMAVPQKRNIMRLEDSKELPDYIESRWKEIIDEILRRNSDGRNRVIQLSEPARQILFKWHSDNETNVASLKNNDLAGIFQKQNTYLFRFCLILHEIHEVCSGKDSEYVDEDIARKAILLAEHYMQSGKRVLRQMELENMTMQHSDLYWALPDEFTSDVANATAKSLNDWDDREVRRYLEKYEKVFFVRVKKGKYIKIL